MNNLNPMKMKTVNGLLDAKSNKTVKKLIIDSNLKNNSNNYLTTS